MFYCDLIFIFMGYRKCSLSLVCPVQYVTCIRYCLMSKYMNENKMMIYTYSAYKRNSRNAKRLGKQLSQGCHRVENQTRRLVE